MGTETKPARWLPRARQSTTAPPFDELVAALNQRMARRVRVRRADAIRHAIAFALDAEA